ncbi:MAG: hypothetical protein ACJ73S_00090 [Mycobacteriales bacterium]
MALFRRHKPPAEVTARLERHDRLLAWGALDGGGYAAASRLGLLYGADGRLGWHEIDKVAWADGVMEIIPDIEVADGVVEPAPPVRLVFTEPGDMPLVVRDRVTRSIVVNTHHQFGGGGGVRVLARRVAGQDGLRWLLRYDRGTDREDPEVRARAEALLAEVRAGE